MEDLNFQQQVAVMRILLDILLIDNKIDTREIDLFNRVNKEMHMPEDSFNDVKEQNSLLALAMVRDFSASEKEEFAKLMGQMIAADEVIHYKEVAIYNVVRDFCNIDQDFDENDYPFLEQ